MFIIKKSASTIFLLFLFNLTQAQLPWFNNMPLYYNSSYAGSGDKLTIAFSSRLIKIDHRVHYSNNLLSPGISNYKPPLGLINDFTIDKYIPQIKSGIGFSMNYGNSVNFDFGGKTQNRIFEPGIYFAPKFSFDGKHTLSPSIGISYLDSKVSFNPESDFYRIYNKSSLEWRSLKVNFGLLYNSKKLQLGISAKVLERELYQRKNYFFDHVLVHGGYNFSRSEDSKFSFTPIIYLNANTFFRSYNRKRDYRPYILPSTESVFANLYLNFRYKKFITGADLQLNLMAGYQSKNIRLLISHNFFSYAVFNYSMQATQFSLRYNFK